MAENHDMTPYGWGMEGLWGGLEYDVCVPSELVGAVCLDTKQIGREGSGEGRNKRDGGIHQRSWL